MACECAICQNNKPFTFPNEIIDAALDGDLVLFCGAGISTEGKNVLPYSFYTSIKKELDVENSSISFPDLMQQFCNQPNGRKKLLRKIRERFNYISSFPELERQATAFHRELAQIHPIKTIITTNWDTYFEDCCGAIPITIAEDFAFWDDNSRCVLKIHGSIQNLSSIIATSEDYKKSFYELQNGIVGATLKSILATKTVVFIGFSFGDEDFSQIIDYLRKEMGNIFPHIYIVTLDETLDARLAYKNSTSIVTSGTFFLHQLKLALIEKGVIKNHSAAPIVAEALFTIEELHDKVSTVDLYRYPCAIYTLSYQDGVIHAFERFLQNSKTGEYNQPERLGRIAGKYVQWTEKYLAAENYWDASYYEGYVNGLVFIEACEEDDDILHKFPFLFLPNAKKDLCSYDIYLSELERVSRGRSKAQKQAKEIVHQKGGTGLVVHHPPY